MELDPHLTFESFVVGPANRLASAAARRAAESPGTNYNPLFLYSEAGLGKSHILSAITQHARENHADLAVIFLTSEQFIEELEEAFETGSQDSLREEYEGVGLFVLDNAQALSGHSEVQDVLLRAVDQLVGKGAQVVVASDQPPAEIKGLDGRLIKRFSSGLIVDLGAPEYETRLTLVRKQIEERGVSLETGVAEMLARGQFRNVSGLNEAVERVIAAQEEAGKPISTKDLSVLFRKEPAFASSLRSEPKTGAKKRGRVPPKRKEEIDWRKAIQAVVDAARVDSIAATPLLALLKERESPIGWRTKLREFVERADRVRAIRAELKALGDPWPETAALILTDTEHLEEAENFLRLGRERMRPFPTLPDGPGLKGLSGQFPELALKAAEQLIATDSAVYNPLFLHSPEEGKAKELLCAAGRSFLVLRPTGTVALVSSTEFAQELVRAITDGLAGAWRERWWTVDMLLLHGVERVEEAGRAQDELLHLFQALASRSARILVAADRPPSAIRGVSPRLSAKFEDGLVVDLGVGSHPRVETLDDSPPAEADAGSTAFALHHERIVWNWPAVEDRIAELEDPQKRGEADGD